MTDTSHRCTCHCQCVVSKEREKKHQCWLFLVGICREKDLSHWIGIQKSLSRKVTVNTVCQLWVFDAKVTILEQVISLDYSYSPRKPLIVMSYSTLNRLCGILDPVTHLRSICSGNRSLWEQMSVLINPSLCLSSVLWVLIKDNHPECNGGSLGLQRWFSN